MKIIYRKKFMNLKHMFRGFMIRCLALVHFLGNFRLWSVSLQVANELVFCELFTLFIQNFSLNSWLQPLISKFKFSHSQISSNISSCYLDKNVLPCSWFCYLHGKWLSLECFEFLDESPLFHICRSNFSL